MMLQLRAVDPDPALDPEHCFNLIRQYKLKNRTLCLPGVYSCCSIEPAVGVSATDHIRLQDVQQGRAVGEQQHLHTMQIIIFIKSRYCYRKSSQDGKLFSENQQSDKKNVSSNTCWVAIGTIFFIMQHESLLICI